MVSERDRMTAQIDGIGAEGIDALRSASVLVVGAGGLGSPVLAYLAAAGVGTIGISDGDIVEESNLQRQIVHTSNRIGMGKTRSAVTFIRALNPHIVTRVESPITSDNAHAVCSRYDIIVDATDNFETKYILSDTCARLDLPHVWGTLVGMDYQVSLFAEGVTLRDVYPEAPPHGSTPTSAQVGVLGAVCGQAGSVMATEVIKWITGIGDPLRGRLLIGDGAHGRWNVVDFRTPPLRRPAPAIDAPASGAPTSPAPHGSPAPHAPASPAPHGSPTPHAPASHHTPTPPAEGRS